MAVNKLRLMLLFLLAAVCLHAPRASAHVLLTDNSGKIGAILHVNPDDDPIAGEPSNLFFDIQGQVFSQHAHDVTLKITDDKNQTTDVSVSVAGSSVSATHAFPRQGVYKVVLTAAGQASGAPDTHAHIFEHSQRVSRGAAGGVLDEPTHSWAEMGMVASLCGLVLLIIIGINRSKEIAIYSKW